MDTAHDRSWRTLSAVLRLGALGLLAAVLAACMGGGSTGAVEASDEAGIADVLVDAEGRTLYAADSEPAGRITCTAGCLEIWRPLTVEKGATLTSDDALRAPLSTTKRPDNGRLQVTFDGRPLYTFAEDLAAGDVKGNNVTDSFGGRSLTWHAMTASGPAPTTSPSESSGGYGY